ncbi:hypothetical protein PAAG_06991 [Paracoccidioides lutzii Pb01]|uniref:Uncharacterized protein n=1 Tax=Paracoccidioides lutzii (strain ATCC MYA-826 / Pb01) TaxID=502779 RepID=C1H8J5_PARBA|nr:hypothetical protein PAAG_06991 [Paracoccidioides lutzii Pb01]EEH36573.2 hypothetical protein PAAG_06991 [Paracoccidioides lutzii Pb01]
MELGSPKDDFADSHLDGSPQVKLNLLSQTQLTFQLKFFGEGERLGLDVCLALFVHVQCSKFEVYPITSAYWFNYERCIDFAARRRVPAGLTRQSGLFETISHKSGLLSLWSNIHQSRPYSVWMPYDGNLNQNLSARGLNGVRQKRIWEVYSAFGLINISVGYGALKASIIASNKLARQLSTTKDKQYARTVPSGG